MWTTRMLGYSAVIFGFLGVTSGLAGQTAPATGPAPLAKDECLRWAQEVERTMSDRDANFLNRTLDIGRVTEEALKGLDAPASFRAGFLMGMRSSNAGRLADQILSKTKEGAKYRLLRVDANQGRASALFRAYSDGLIYHEFRLERDPNGGVRAFDAYLFITGETLSQTLRGIAAPALAQVQKATGTGKALEEIRALTEAAATMPRMQKLIQEGKGREALDLYGKLPEGLRGQKALCACRIQAAALAGDEEYAKAMEDYRKRFPGDPSADLVGIDLSFLRGKFDEVLQALGRLEKRVGKDPALDLVRSNCHLKAGDLDKAMDFASKAAEAEPDLVDAYWTLVAVSLARKDFKETAKLLTLIETRLGIEIADLTEVAEYAEFVKSPQYKEWMKSRAGRRTSE